MRSTPYKRILVFLVILSIAGYLFHAEIPPVYGGWTNPSVSISPPSITAYPGSTVTFNIQVQGTSDPNDPVELDPLYIYTPTNEAYPPWLTITLSQNDKQAPFTATMFVEVSSSAQFGNHEIRLDAKAASQSYPYQVHSNWVDLIIKPKITIAPTLTFPTPATTPGPTTLPFDFTLMLMPSSVTVAQGETANYQLQLTYSDPSYSGIPINYQVAGLSPGLNWIPSGGGLIPISTSPTTPPGTYQITVVGSAQGLTHQTGATLIVTESMSTTVDEEETATTSIESTSPTITEPTTVTLTEQITTQTSTPTTKPKTDEEGSDITSQLLNPITLMAIVIAVLATALITTLIQKSKTQQSRVQFGDGVRGVARALFSIF